MHIPTYTTAIVLLSLFVASGPTQAQDLSSIESALWPLPIHLREEASVLQATEADTFNTLRTGKNGLFCIVDQPNNDRFSVECHPESLRAYLELRRYLSHTVSRPVRDSLLTHELRSGQLAVPVGALSRFISGKLNPQTGLPDSVWVWDEIDVPFAGSAETDLPTENAGAAPWLMSAHEHGAHIMIGYSLVAWPDLMKTVHRNGEME